MSQRCLLDSIKPAYDRKQHVSSPVWYRYAVLAVSSLAVAVIVACTHCAYRPIDSQTEFELAWMVGYTLRWYACPKTVTHPSTNPARRRVTWLKHPTPLPLRQNVTVPVTF